MTIGDSEYRAQKTVHPIQADGWHIKIGEHMVQIFDQISTRNGSSINEKVRTENIYGVNEGSANMEPDHSHCFYQTGCQAEGRSNYS